MLKVQEYLRSGKTIEDLNKEFAIEYRLRNSKVIVSYDQIFSPMGERIVQECRGLILNEKTFDIICFPLIKFFNAAEGHCPPINWKTAKIQEKIDGSCVSCYFCPIKNQWLFSTRKMIEAEGTCPLGKTYSEIAHLALKEMNIDFDQLQTKLNKNYTYVFELTSPYTTVYIQYPETRLTLLAVRDITTLKELDPKPIAKELGFPSPIEYPVDTIDNLVTMVNSWKGDEQEGVVVVDEHYNRIKVKNIAYVTGQAIVFALSASDRNIMKMILLGQDDDIFGKCAPLIQEKITLYKDKFVNMVAEAKSDWSKVKDITDIKQFANEIKTKPHKAVLFNLKRGKIDSISEYYKSLVVSKSGIDSVVKLCGLEMEEGQVINNG